MPAIKGALTGGRGSVSQARARGAGFETAGAAVAPLQAAPASSAFKRRATLLAQRRSAMKLRLRPLIYFREFKRLEVVKSRRVSHVGESGLVVLLLCFYWATVFRQHFSTATIHPPTVNPKQSFKKKLPTSQNTLPAN
jgi:hypothetical protein